MRDARRPFWRRLVVLVSESMFVPRPLGSRVSVFAGLITAGDAQVRRGHATVRSAGCVTHICVGVILSHAMPDTKRGRERKGRKKRMQRREYEIERELEARHRDLDFDELYEDAEIELEL